MCSPYSTKMFIRNLRQAVLAWLNEEELFYMYFIKKAKDTVAGDTAGGVGGLP